MNCHQCTLGPEGLGRDESAITTSNGLADCRSSSAFCLRLDPRRLARQSPKAGRRGALLRHRCTRLRRRPLHRGRRKSRLQPPFTDWDRQACGLYETSFPDLAQASARPSEGWPIGYVTGSEVLQSTLKINILDLTSIPIPLRHFEADAGTHSGDVRWDILGRTGIFTTDMNTQDFRSPIVGDGGRRPGFHSQLALDGFHYPWLH